MEPLCDEQFEISQVLLPVLCGDCRCLRRGNIEEAGNTWPANGTGITGSVSGLESRQGGE